MSVALVALKPWGLGWPAVFRVINSSSAQLGETFAVVVAAITGNFDEGETINFSDGGSAIVVEQKASPDRLVIASMTGTISGSGTGASSGATIASVSVEGLESTPGAQSLQQTRAVEFGGKVFAMQNQTIYVLDETLGVSGGRWREAHRLQATGTQAGRLCLVVVNIGAVPHLYGVYCTSSASRTISVKSADGVVWTEVTVGAGHVTNLGGGVTVISNTLYFVNWQVAGFSTVISWSIDPSTDSRGLYSGGGGNFDNDRSTIAIVQHRGRIFAPGRDVNSFVELLELVGSTWILIHVFSGLFTNAVGKTAMFSGNDGALYMIKCGKISGFICVKYDFTGDLVATDVTDPVLPPTLRSGAGANLDGCWEVYVDNEARAHTTDDDPPDIFLWFRGNSLSSGTTRTTYLWNDSAAMTQLDTGGAPSELLLPNSQHWGGGMFSFTSGNNDIRIVSPPTPIFGGERLTFRIFKKPGTTDVTDVKLRLLYRLSNDSDNGGAPNRWGYLSNPSAGAVSVDNREITGLVADSVQGSAGGTEYTVDWLAVSQDGVTNFTRVRRSLIAYL